MLGSRRAVFTDGSSDVERAFGSRFEEGVKRLAEGAQVAALDFVGFEGGASICAFQEAGQALQTDENKTILSVAAPFSAGERRGLLIKDPEEGKAVAEIYLWRFKRLAYRLKESLMSLFMKDIDAMQAALAAKGENKGIRTVIFDQMRNLYARFEDLAFVAEHYSTSPEGEFSGVKRVGRWRESIEAAVAELAALKVLGEKYFDKHCIEQATLVYEALLAGKDYTAAPKERRSGDLVRQELEHGHKVSFGELQELFRKQLPSDGAGLEFSLESGVNMQDGAYLSPFCFIGVAESLVKIMQEDGGPGGGIKITASISERDDPRFGGKIDMVVLQVRHAGHFGEELLEEVAVEEEGRANKSTQRLFSMGEAERTAGVSSPAGWVVRDVIEYMQGSARAFNEGEEAVVELVLRRSI
jgi:hypothetical protein